MIATVDSAEESIAIATRALPDLILMDIRLKGEKDGVQAANEIRRQVDLPSCLSDGIFRPTDRRSGSRE